MATLAGTMKLIWGQALQLIGNLLAYKRFGLEYRYVKTMYYGRREGIVNSIYSNTFMVIRFLLGISQPLILHTASFFMCGRNMVYYPKGIMHMLFDRTTLFIVNLLWIQFTSFPILVFLLAWNITNYWAFYFKVSVGSSSGTPNWEILSFTSWVSRVHILPLSSN